MNNKHITWLILTVSLFALVALGTFAFVQVNTNDGFRDAFSNVLDEIDYKRGDGFIPKVFLPFSTMNNWMTPDEVPSSDDHEEDEIGCDVTQEETPDYDQSPPDVDVTPIPPDLLSHTQGLHTGLWVGDARNSTEVAYYIPHNFDISTFQYMMLIHGAGDCHRVGMLTNINLWKATADRENLVLVAPNFDRVYFDANGDRILDPQFCDNVYVQQYNSPMHADCDASSCRYFESDEGCSFYEQYSCSADLWDFVYGINDDGARADTRLIEIFGYFKTRLATRETFNLYGHSGGGQFVSRFLLTHADLLGDKVGISSAGSYLFPTDEYAYPYGFQTSGIDTDFKSQLGVSYADIKSVQYLDNVVEALAKHVVVIAGSQDNTPLYDAPWQGPTVAGRATTYFNAMMDQNSALRAVGRIPPQFPQRWELIIQQGVGHDAFAGSEEAQSRLYP